jgi:nitroreductase
VLDTIHRRRAVRSYRSAQPDDESIRRLLDAAVHAPTAMHAEPWSFVVVQDRDVLKRISERAKALMVERATAHRELLRAPGATPDQQHLKMLSDPSFNIFYDAGTLIVICARPLNEFASADCWLAAENLMLAACALGLGTCCIGFALPALHTAEVRKELGIPDGIEPIVAIIVGEPRGETAVVPRRPPEILRWLHTSAS